MPFCVSCGAATLEGSKRCSACEQAACAPAPAAMQPQSPPAHVLASAPDCQQRAVQQPYYGQPPVAPVYSQQPPFYKQPGQMGGISRKSKAILFGFLAFGTIFVILVAALILPGLFNKKPENTNPIANPGIVAPVSGPIAPVTGQAGIIPSNYFLSYSDDDNSVIYGMSGAVAAIPNSYTIHSATADRMLCYYFSRDPDTYDSSLYVLCADGTNRLILERASSLILCADNDLAFFCSGMYGTDLYRYSYAANRATLVATDVRYYTVSPDGKIVLFSNYEYLSVVRDDAAPVRLSAVESARPISISNDGTIYSYEISDYSSDDTTIQFVNSENEALSAEVVFKRYIDSTALNLDASEILVSSEGMLYRYSALGIEPIVQDMGYRIEPVLPAQIAQVSNYTFVYACSSFSSLYFSVTYKPDYDTSLFYYQQGSAVQTICESIYSAGAQISSDLQTLFYYDYEAGTLCAGSMQADGSFATDTIAETSEYAISPDGNIIYYLAYKYPEGYILYCIQDGGQPQKIASDVERFQIGGPDGTSCTYIVGGDWYSGEGGELFLFADGNATHIAYDVLSVSPPTAENSFAYTANAAGESYDSPADLYIYNANGATCLARQIEDWSGIGYLQYDWFNRIREW